MKKRLKLSSLAIMFPVLLVVAFFAFRFYEQFHWDYPAEAYRFSIGHKGYDLAHPARRWDMPRKLVEISGITYYKKNQLACIQDEDGDIFVFHLNKDEVVVKEQFGKKGDYEGVEIVRDTCYVLKSNGNIYYFSIGKEGIGDVHKIKTGLSSDNDTEGLGYDPVENKLLIACKDKPGTKKTKIKNSRTVYALDLSKKKFDEKPLFTVKAKTYNEWLEKKGLDKKKHKPFKPSAVAVHPATRQIFLIGSVGKMMVILNHEGTIDDLIPLNPSVFLQPEGICFSPEGDLYISSEGRDGKGYILKF